MNTEPIIQRVGAQPRPPALGERTAVWLEAYSAVYVEVPKVACSSIKIAFASVLGIDLGPVAGDPHLALFPDPPSLLDLTGSRLYPGQFSFAFVRNPWDRLVSCYRDKILGERRDFTHLDPERGFACCMSQISDFWAAMSFNAFVRAVATMPDERAPNHIRSQHTFLTGGSGGIGVDYVGRFETLAGDFKQVCKRLGIRDLRLPVVQAAAVPHRYSEYYTSETRKLVAERFREDIKLFEYTFTGT